MTSPAVPAPVRSPGSAGPEWVRIQPTRGWVSLQLGELWRFRDLLYFLTWRDLKVRYKQTALGVSWAVLQPLAMMVVFSLFFGRLAKMPSDDIPYPLFSFSGLVPWTFFATALTNASNSLVGSANLIKKVYFPRLAIPTATVAAALVDFAIAFVMLLVMIPLYGRGYSTAALALPLFVLLAVMAALGAGLWLSALNVRYRDVKYVVPFLSQLWMFATPIAYPSSLLSGKWRAVYAINPMVGIIDGFRWALVGTPRPGVLELVIAIVVCTLMLMGGAMYFRRTERTFADIA